MTVHIFYDSILCTAAVSAVVVVGSPGKNGTNWKLIQTCLIVNFYPHSIKVSINHKINRACGKLSILLV